MSKLLITIYILSHETLFEDCISVSKVLCSRYKNWDINPNI